MKHTMDHTILQNSEQVRMGQEFVTGLEASEARMKTNNEEIYCSVVCDVNGLFTLKQGNMIRLCTNSRNKNNGFLNLKGDLGRG